MKMNDAQLDDLKQYIHATVSQSAESVKTELRSEIRASETRIRKDMEDGFAGVAEAITTINDKDDEQDKRITKLEKQIA